MPCQVLRRAVSEACLRAAGAALSVLSVKVACFRFPFKVKKPFLFCFYYNLSNKKQYAYADKMSSFGSNPRTSKEVWKQARTYLP
jgi:hypothetical protein